MMKTMLSAVLVLSAVAGNALASSDVYTDKSAFLGASGAGAFALNEFNDLSYFGFAPDPLTYKTGTPANYVGPTYSIGAVPPAPAFAAEGAIQFGDNADGLVITIPAGATAIGANIYAMDVNYAYPQAFLTVGLSDTTSWGGWVSGTNSFVGFVAAVGGPLIQSFTLSYTNDWNLPETALYGTVDNLYVVGATVPEPSVVVMNLAVIVATVGGAACYRRRSQKGA